MTPIICDRCDSELDATGYEPGTKVECPHCGDINIVPEAPDAAARTTGSTTGESTTNVREDERTLLVVRPSFWRSHPIKFGLLAFAPLVLNGVRVGMGWTAANEPFWIGWGIVPLAGWVVLGVFWFRKSMFTKITVTNRRTTMCDGLFGKRTSEVRHSSIRNFEIRQGVINRVFNVGEVRISSSAGSDDAEICVRDVPSPGRIRKIIDNHGGK